MGRREKTLYIWNEGNDWKSERSKINEIEDILMENKVPVDKNREEIKYKREKTGLDQGKEHLIFDE